MFCVLPAVSIANVVRYRTYPMILDRHICLYEAFHSGMGLRFCGAVVTGSLPAGPW